ncbi:hypothetical protein GCM10020331_072680 [Ectobacillus funiculus]
MDKKIKQKLYRYVRKQENTHATPLLLIYALINKPYIMDLTPGSSLVEYLVDRGFDVYLLDWGTFGPEDSHLKFDDFVMDYIGKAVKKRYCGFPERRISLFLATAWAEL